MNIYGKLALMRVELQKMEIKKSGRNDFAKYDYMELGDFLPRINEIMAMHNVASVVCFAPDMATLTLIDADKPEDTIVFTSPMSTANLKGCHDVQNLGAAQTYLRRYLYVNAFEIVEHDALDGENGQDTKGGSKKKEETTAPSASDKTEEEAKVDLMNRIASKHKVQASDVIEGLQSLYMQGVIGKGNYLDMTYDELKVALIRLDKLMGAA